MAKDYDVGNILINIETKANTITQTLDNTINRLSSLKKVVNGVSKLNMDNVHKNLNSISKLNFDNILTTFKTLENFDTKSVSSFVRQIKNISNINLDKLDFLKLNYQFNQLTRIIDPFIQKIISAEPSLRAFSNAIDLGRVNAQLSVAEARIKAINQSAKKKEVLDNLKIEKANAQLQITKKRLANINKNSDKTRINFNKIFNIGKIYFFVNYFKRFATSLVNVAKSAINFNETLNKFQVSMGGYYERSLQFVNSLTKAFNLSTESIMNYQSTFKNMLSSLGNLSGDVSYELSETLTRMALDYASLFNISTERAMEQFQAVLSGQIRSIRSVSGYDVSETSIFNIYKELGGTKTMRQLDQIEKRLLRIIAVQQQMEETQALGDFAKTIDTTANQLKQLSETVKEIGRWLGQLTMAYMQPFIESLLAGAIAVRELLKALNIAKGYVYEDFGEKSIFGEMTESAEETNEAVNALKKNLLGFDKLNILGESATSETADYSLLTSKIKEYSRSLDEVTNKANEISIKILEWLGYTYDVNGELTGAGTRLKTILGLVTGLLVSITSSAIFTKIASVVKIIGSLVAEGGALSAVAGKLGVIGGIVGAIIGLFAILYTTNEDFRKSIDGLLSSIVDVFAPIIKEIVDIVQKILVPLLTTIIDEIANILVPMINAIAPIISLIGNVISALSPAISIIAELVGDILNSALSKIFDKLNTIIEPIQMIIDLFSGEFQIILTFILGIVETISATFSAIKETIKSIINENKNGDFFNLENLSNVEERFKELGESIKEIWSGVGEKIKEIWSGISDTISGVFVGIANSLLTAMATFVNAFIGKINDIISSVSGIWDWTGLPSIPQIPTWTPELIPALASGGVINQPTVAMMGEYAGANSNPEIVTPENLMRQVFVESMLPIAQIIASGNNEVVGAIEELANRPIEMNGRKVSEAIYSDLERVSIRKGKTMFATTG